MSIFDSMFLASQYNQARDTGLGQYESNPERQAQAEALLYGAGTMAVDFPLGLSEVVFNATKYANPYYHQLPEEQKNWQHFPKPFKEPLEEAQKIGGPMASAMSLAGGFAVGGGIAQVPMLRNVLFATPVENAITNMATKYFSNPVLGETIAGQIINKTTEAVATVTGRVIGGGVANVVSDTAYNISESIDEQGKVDTEKLGNLEFQSFTFGSVFGAGGAIADPNFRKQVKDIKGLTKEALIGASNSSKRATEINAQRKQEIQQFEEQKQIQKQIEKQQEAEVLKAPVEEVEVLNETVNLETRDLDWAKQYKEIRNDYEVEFEKLESINPEAKEKDNLFLDLANSIRDGWKQYRQPIFRELQEKSIFGHDAVTAEVRAKRKKAARQADAEVFKEEYDKLFKHPIEPFLEGLEQKLPIIEKKFFDPFLKKDTKDEKLFKLFTTNGEFDKAKAVLINQKGASEKSVQLFDNLIDDIFGTMGREAVALDVIPMDALEKPYFTRFVLEPEKFSKHFENKLSVEERAAFNENVFNIEFETNQTLTPRERANLLEQFIKDKKQAYHKTGHARTRKIEKLELDMVDYYADTIPSIKEYINSMTDSLEQARLWKLKDPLYKPTPQQVAKRMEKLLEEGSKNIDEKQLELEAVRSLYKDNMIKSPVILEQDIAKEMAILKQEQEKGKWVGYEDEQLEQLAVDRLKDDGQLSLIDRKVRYLVQSEQLPLEEAREYKKLLETAYIKGKEATPLFSQTMSNITYGSLLNNINTTITQIKDIAPTMSRAGTARALKNYFKAITSQMTNNQLPWSLTYTLDDLGLEKNLDIIYGISPQSKAIGSKFVASTVGPFVGAIDRAGQEGRIQSVLELYQQKAKTPEGQASIKKEFGTHFQDNEWDIMFKNLQDKTDHWTVRDLLIYDIGKVYPTSHLDKPKFYLENPHMRMAYDLQNFSIKRQDFIYNDLVKKAQAGDKEAGGELLRFLMLAPLVSYSVESARDGLRDKKDDASVVDNLFMAFLDTIGLNQIAYLTRTGRKPSKQDVAMAATSSVMNIPGVIPAGVAYDIGSDIYKILNESPNVQDIRSMRYIPVVGNYLNPMFEEAGKSPLEKRLNKQYKNVGNKYQGLQKRYEKKYR